MPALRLLLLCASFLVPFAAVAAGDAESGRALAERWCASCHAIGPAQTTDAAPAFTTLGAQGRRDPARLRAWLADPHPPMPNPGLSRQQIEDVIAFMQSVGAR
jgi:mono/diheme cytochrome c family protein